MLLETTTHVTLGLAAAFAAGGYAIGRFVNRFNQIDRWQQATVKLLAKLVRNDTEHGRRLDELAERIGMPH